jgi:hypothetical protein
MYIRLLVRRHPRHLWPLLSLNLIYFGYFFRNSPEQICPIQASFVPRTKPHVHLPWLTSFIQRIRPGPRPITLRNKPIFDGEELLAHRLTIKLKDRHLSTVRDCVFNTFAAILHIWRPSPPSTTWRRAMPWWQETYLTSWVTFTESCNEIRPFSLNDPQQVHFGTYMDTFMYTKTRQLHFTNRP